MQRPTPNTDRLTHHALKSAYKSYLASCRRAEELYKVRVSQILAKAQEKGGASA